MSTILTLSICISFMVWSALWRLWLGGIPRYWPIERGHTQLKLFSALLVVGATTFLLRPDIWQLAPINALGYFLFWRGGGNPLNGDPNRQWWIAGLKRYLGASVLWAAVLSYYVGYNAVWIASAGVFVPVIYFLDWSTRAGNTYALIKLINSIGKPGCPDEECFYHYSELNSGLVVASLMLISIAV